MSLNDVCQPVSVALGENDTQQRESGCDAPRLKEERVGTATFTATLTSSSKRKLSPMNDQAPSRLKSILQRKGTSCNDADFSQAREGLGEIVNEDNNEHGECEPNRFRDENREIFRKCLLQGMEVALGMALSTLTENHCAIQAMLLEDILFEEFQDTPAAYRSQSCLLQTYLSDCEQCPLVCARVLLEKIDLRDLIFMTPMNLKEHAEVAAQDQHGEEVSNGTVGKCLNEASENNEGDNNSKVQAASTKERLMSLATMQATNDMRSLPITTAESLPSFSSGVRCISLGTSRSMLEVMEADGDGLMHDKLSSSPNQMQANTNGDNEFVDGSDHDDSNELQFSPQVALPDEYDHKHEEEDKMLKRQRRANARSKKYIKLRNGYKHFKIKISGIVFHTFLVYDTYLASPSYRVGEILSKSWESFERCKVEEMNNYIYDLIGTVQDTMCKWQLVPIRLSLTGCKREDINNYCKFCSKYEAKERVAIFKIDRHTKIFLVPPKFVNLTECLCGASYHNSAYAVILTDSKNL